MNTHDPEQMEWKGGTVLKIQWKDGHESLYPWAQLRAACPCAACREGKPLEVDAAIHPVDVQPVGRYAIGIRWSDGHSTGIFSHEYLRSLCTCEACRPSQFEEG